MAKTENIEEHAHDMLEKFGFQEYKPDLPEYKRGELDGHAARLRGNKNSDEYVDLRCYIADAFAKISDEAYILYHIIDTGCSEAEAWPKLEEIKRANIILLE